MKSRKYIHFLAKPEASYYLILTAVGLLTRFDYGSFRIGGSVISAIRI